MNKDAPSGISQNEAIDLDDGMEDQDKQEMNAFLRDQSKKISANNDSA